MSLITLARLKFGIEVDGESHVGAEAIECDAKRQREIEALGLKFLRVSNQQVYRELEGVVETIRLKVAELSKAQEGLADERSATFNPPDLQTSPPL